MVISENLIYLLTLNDFNCDVHGDLLSVNRIELKKCIKKYNYNDLSKSFKDDESFFNFIYDSYRIEFSSEIYNKYKIVRRDRIINKLIN